MALKKDSGVHIAENGNFLWLLNPNFYGPVTIVFTLSKIGREWSVSAALEKRGELLEVASKEEFDRRVGEKHVVEDPLSLEDVKEIRKEIEKSRRDALKHKLRAAIARKKA
jgi:hypothetical protein